MTSQNRPALYFQTVDELLEQYIDGTACIKSTCFNMTKAGYIVHVLSDCITSYDKKKLPEMLEYYAQKGCSVQKLNEII